ncbi:twin-arginine translocation signal domain-containing protein [bacterium]|nr:twin-arginine translocation signal domain-containing protein [bacterium]
MSPTRRDFIKDAAVIGAAAGTGLTARDTVAENGYGEGPVDENTRCPYFDQPLFCKGKNENGKYLCEE